MSNVWPPTSEMLESRLVLSGVSAEIVVEDTTLKAGESTTVTITFTDDVTNFGLEDLSAQNGTLDDLQGSGSEWTVRFRPSEDIEDLTNEITLDLTGIRWGDDYDGFGEATSNNYEIDTKRPTANITISDQALRIGETAVVTITFSEKVTGFVLTDLSTELGVLSNLQTSDDGQTWTATLTPYGTTLLSSMPIVLHLSNVTDEAGNAGTGDATSDVASVDTIRPDVTITLSTNVLKADSTADVTFTFNEAVTEFTTDDILVDNGTITGLTSTDGGKTWTALLTPTAEVVDSTNVVRVTMATLTDMAGNAGTGTKMSPNYSVSTLRPTLTINMSPTALRSIDTSVVTFTFSEAVTGFTTDDISPEHGTITNLTSTDNIVWTATFTPALSVDDNSNVISVNMAGVTSTATGNAGTGTTNSGNYSLSTTRPTATIVVSDTSLKAGETSLVTFTFSESVSGFTNTDLTIVNGTLTPVTSTDGGITWTATFTPTSSINDTTNVITLNNAGVFDQTTNPGSGTTDSNNFAIDTVRPTATIVVANPSLKIGSTSVVTITFSQPVTGFDNTDLDVANGSLSNVIPSDGGTTWTANLTPSSNIADATNVITLNNTGVTGANGNPGSGTTNSDNYTVDTVRPTATIETSGNIYLKAGATKTVTITFSEPVSGLTNEDFSFPYGTLSEISTADDGLTWTATLTPAADINGESSPITLDLTGVTDVNGNTGTGTATSSSIIVDTVAPTVEIVVDDTSFLAGETSYVTITFSEDILGLSLDDFSVANGALSDPSNSNGKTFSATFTPSVDIADTTNLITLKDASVKDIAGNSNEGTTDSNNFAINTKLPTATIVVTDFDLALGQSSVVTITFSEAVTDFTNADLTVANGTLTEVSSTDGGTIWTATLIPNNSVEDATNIIILNNTTVTSVAGNAGSGTTDSNNYTVDTVRPTATITVSPAALSIGQTAIVTVTFSEEVPGFGRDDLVVAGGTLSVFTSDDDGVTER